MEFCRFLFIWTLTILVSITFANDEFDIEENFKNERPRFEDFLNYGFKKFKSNKDLENEIIKSKVNVLGSVLKKHVNILRKVPGQVVELVFLVDSSASVGAENFFSELKFVKKLLADFTVSFNQTRIALITFSSKDKVIRQIDHVTQSSDMNHKCSLLERELPRIRYFGGGTYTLGALMEAQSVLAVSRADAVKAVFLITDGYSNGGDPRPAAEFLKKRGINLFTFGIQNGNVKELHDMASEPKEEHSYILNSFQEFEALARRALHEDLSNGMLIAQDSAACSTLCEERDNCCDSLARCACGTHTGYYACTCRPGYYGTGLKGDCKACPAGTYRDEEGPSDIKGCKECPDPNMLSPVGATSQDQCYCNRGYTQIGMKCRRVTCRELTPPPNGYFVREKCEQAVNAACGIRCRTGYRLEGSSIRLCRADGTWSGKEPTCIVRTCQMLKTPRNGEMICSSKEATIDTQCHFLCNPGYQLVGSKMRTCLPVAMWDGLRAFCRPIFCPPLPLTTNGVLKPESCELEKMPYGSKCEFGCTGGYQVSGPLKTVCGEKGAWSEGSEETRCVDVEPPIIRCPENKVVETQPNEKFAFVEWEKPFAEDRAGGEVFFTTIPATTQPTKLKIGKHNIKILATDEWGNRAHCSFYVTVKDKEPPRVDRCESPPTFLSRDENVDVYWEEPIFSDNSGGPIKITRSKEPGKFPQGSTMVEYSAADVFGNIQYCNITITVQKHACTLPIDPIHGFANCSEYPDAVYCTLTCEDGYAMAIRPTQDYFCAYDGVWQPDNNPLPFPDCSASAISNTISHSGEIAVEDETDSVCNDIFFMGQIENKIQAKLEEALSQVCQDDALCEVSAVEAACESLLSEAEEEFNSIAFTRKKREINQDRTIESFWSNDIDDGRWKYWVRGSNIRTFNRRRKREVSNHDIVEKDVNIIESQGNTTVSKNTNIANYMGILTELIIKSQGKDLGFSRLSSFLSNIGSEINSDEFDAFIGKFSEEFGEEKANELIKLWEMNLNDHKLTKFNFTISHNTSDFITSNLSHSNGSSYEENMTEIYESQDTYGLLNDIAVEQNQETEEINPDIQVKSPTENLKKTLKIKFNIGGHGKNAKNALGNVFENIRQWSKEGKLDFEDQQLKVAAIRLSEDPEYICEPGSVPVDDLCVNCAVGTFFNVVEKECQICPPGSFQSEEGQVSCKICPENTSTKKGPAKSDEDCKSMCLPGSWSEDGLEPCITCELGEYQDEYTSTNCFPCPFETTTWRRGSWVIEECKESCPLGEISETGLRPCLPCPKGYFQNMIGQTSCLRCPEGVQTTNRSSGSLLDCIGIEEDQMAAYTSFEDLPVNDCFSEPCQNSGNCTALEAGFTCTCYLGYTGQLCESEIDECQSSPCLNNGTCQDLLGNFECTCAAGFNGHACEINVDECDSTPCHNNASCVDQINGFRCVCESGFTGETCETDIDDCVNAPCSKDSKCVDLISDYKCICQPGFEGRHCNIDIDECDSDPCIHGSCTDLIDDFKCTCEAGYEGRLCDVDRDDCENNPCLNNSTCTDWLNGFSCNCPPAYTGKTCETLMSTEFILDFPTSGIVNYASIQGSQDALHEATVCLWMLTVDKENYGTPFSYSNEDNDNALTLTDYSGFVFYVNGEKVITDINVNDGNWHMICTTWTSKNGAWSIYKDGMKEDSGEGLSAGKKIEGDGVYVLGQEQDSKGGDYSAPESFIGQMTLLNIWNKALQEEEVSKLYRTCDRYDGNVKSWPDFQAGLMGQIKLKPSTFCSGCEPLSTPQHGKYSTADSFPGTLTTFSCDDGYKRYSGSDQRECSVVGKWSGEEPVCRPVSCGFPGLFRNGKIGGNSFDFGDQVSYSCNRGFKLEGDSKRTCQADGKWSDKAPECQIIKCSLSKTEINDGSLLSHRGLYLPTNKALFKCNRGFQMDGPAFQECGRNGEWEGAKPSCQSKYCTTLPKVENGEVLNTTSEGHHPTVEIKCDFGYKLKGGSKVACTKDKTWPFPIPKCVQQKCPKPPPIKNGNFKMRVSMKGKQAKYKCNHGFVLEGPDLITCNQEGFWGVSEWPKCLRQPCPPPDIPKNGKELEEKRWAVGDKLLYSCLEGYILKGNPHKICKLGIDEGYWEGNTPTCEEIYCPVLNTINGGSFSIVHEGKQLKKQSQAPIQIFGEIELTRKRRSLNGFPDISFPSQPQNNYDYKDNVDSDKDSVHRILFPGEQLYLTRSRKPKYEDNQIDNAEVSSFPVISFGSQSIDSETELGKDQTHDINKIVDKMPAFPDINKFSQTTDSGLFSQTPDDYDVFSQTIDNDDIEQFDGIELSQVSQTSEGDIFSQTPEDYEGFSQTLDNNDIEQFDGLELNQVSQTSESDVFSQTPVDYESFSQTLDNNDIEQFDGLELNQVSQTSDSDVFSQTPVDYESFSQTLDNNDIEQFDDLELNQVSQTSESDVFSQTPEDYEGFSQTQDNNDIEQFDGLELNQVSQTSESDVFSQKPEDYDVFSQVVDNNEIEQYDGQISQTSEIDALSQTPEDYDFLSQTADYDEIEFDGQNLELSQNSNQDALSQSSGFDFDYSHEPEAFTLNYGYNTTVKYECKPGYKLIGNVTRRCSENADWDQPEPRCYEQHCPELNALANGRMLYIGNGAQSKVGFECNEGHELIGSHEIICLIDRNWSDELPTCKPLICEEPMAPENGTVSFNSTYIKAIAIYSCSSGFVLEGSNERHCGMDGYWNGSLPRCVGIVCDTPSVIEDGYIYYEGNLDMGSVVEYGCNECYRLNGLMERVCMDDGTWSLEEPSCEIINCSDITYFDNGRVVGNQNTCGSLIEYECNPGFEMKGFKRSTCTESEYWIPTAPTCEIIKCNEPQIVENADIIGSSYKFGDQITYKCKDGYELKGNSMLTCTDRQTWKGDVPECLIVNCTKPKGPSNGRVRVSGLFYGASVRIVCDPGFRLEGDGKLMCQSNKKWDKEMPFCAPIVCPAAPRPDYSFYNSTELYFESFTVLNYNCDEGYVPKLPNNLLLCNAKGQWEGEIIKCNPVDCGKPNLINGHVEGNMYTYGYIVDFYCSDGYKLIGNKKSICESNGSWDNLPSCELITCETPDEFKHGKIIFDNQKNIYESKIDYECSNGYYLQGSTYRTCLYNGLWSGIAPTCIPVSCPEPPEAINAEIYGDVYEFGHNISYKCNDGYNLKGNSVLSCQSGGIWSSDYPICESIMCDDRIDIENGKWFIQHLTSHKSSIKKSHSQSKGNKKIFQNMFKKFADKLQEKYEKIVYRLGDVTEYVCDSGYQLQGHRVRECGKNGWSSSLPKCQAVTCPVLSYIEHGKTYGDSNTFGSTVIQECDTGYELFGSATQKCQENGEWSNSNAACRPLVCPRPTDLTNGKTISQDIHYQSIATYVCNPGFRLQGESTRTCQSDASWSGERSVCLQIFCDDPKTIPYAIIVYNDLQVGAQAKYECMEGHKMEGNSIMQCQSDGTWNSKPPKCVQIVCDPLDIDPNGNVSSLSRNYASKVIFSCRRGFKLEGSEISTCLNSGSWSHPPPSCRLINCLLPENPINGFIEGHEEDAEIFDLRQSFSKTFRRKGKSNRKTKSGRKSKLISRKVYVVDEDIKYKCNVGWEMVGTSTAHCTELGTWSTGTPKCQRISCGKPEVPTYARYMSQKYLYEDKIHLTCQEGYILRGNPTLKCLEDGSWKKEKPECVPVFCGAPVEVPHSYTSYKTADHGLHHHFGSIVTYACDEGYVLEGSVYLTCSSSGRWIGPREIPVCMEMPCAHPPVVARASSREVNNGKQTAVYTCDPGYILEGDDTVQCSLGRWIGLNATCNPVYCSEPPVLERGSYEANFLTFGGIANYSCAKGYEVVGNPSIQCGVRGNWLGELPECQKVDCGPPEELLYGEMFYKSTIYEEEVTYKCQEGYELKGVPTRTCTADCSWSGHLPQCHRLKCGEMEPPQNGFIIGVGQHYGDEVKFSCDRGHVLSTNDSSICQSNGLWSVTNPTCESVQCGPPPFMANGELLDESEIFVFGDLVTYSCREGFIARGELLSECQKDGNWTNIRGQCSKVSCGRPRVNGDGAMVLGRSFYYKDVVRIRCPPGSSLEGSSLLTCLGNGTWSGGASCNGGCRRKCFNGGVCLNEQTCSCTPGYVGDRCQKPVCKLPCLNGGTCLGPYKCQCKTGYVGRRCQRPVCQGDCGRYGKCIRPDLCLCQDGQTAKSCPEYSDYEEFSRPEFTQYQDWDLAYSQRSRPRFK